MKKIIVLVLLLVFVTGCYGTKEECEDCTQYIQARDTLGVENNRLKTDIINLQKQVIDLKNKTSIGNTYNSSTVYIGDCTTCTRLLNQKEVLLEECYADDSDDSYRDLYKSCKDDRNDLEDDVEELELEVDEVEDERDDCISDLKECEEA